MPIIRSQVGHPTGLSETKNSPEQIMTYQPYTDPTTGEFVGEFEYREPDRPDEVRRKTEWFGTEAEAVQFSRTGPTGRRS